MDGIVAAKETALAPRQELGEDLYLRWVAYLDAKPKTVETYTRNIRPFFSYMRERGISRPVREDIIAYRESLTEDHKPTTVQAYLQAVKLFFQWTAQEGLYPNVAERVKGAKLDRSHKKDYLTSKQAGRFLESIDRTTLKGKRDYAICCLLVTTGLREISVVRANVEDIRTAGDDVALYFQGKGHDERAEYVKLSEPVEAAIREYLVARGPVPGGAPLFASASNRNGGGRMTTRSVSRLAKENMVAAGYDSDRLTGHSLRHTAATLNLLNGGTLEETQQLLGHVNIGTTMIYSHALERAKNRSEYRISRAIFG